MASANDLFPSTWTYPALFSTAGQVPALNLPAVPGVSHIITKIVASLWAGASGLSFSDAVAIYDVTLGTFIYSAGGNNPILALKSFVPAGSFAEDTQTYDGELWMPVGHAIQVQISVALPANLAAYLMIQGHDV